MPRKPISFELDFMIKDIFPRFTVKQFDDVSFNIKPKNQGLDYDTTGMTGKIFVGVNNDMFMQTKNITVSNNNINILLDRNMLQKQGRAYAEIELTDSNGTITSSSFIFDIDPKIGEGGQIPGEYEGFVEKYERLISEFKTQINSTINNCNSNVNTAIKQCNTSVDNKLNTVDSLINVKISDFEKRFNKLISSQQQDAEVIDARDGETSLKARLDRDIEKAKQVYINVEGSNISTDSSSGYLKDVEIKGNTIQDADNLADIKSVGEKVEGQELYEIPVLSVGKNLFDISKLKNNSLSDTNGEHVADTNYYSCNEFIKIKPNTTYLLSNNKTLKGKFYYYDSSKRYISNVLVANKEVSPANAYYLKFRVGSADYSTTLQLEEGTQATPYEPYIEDKLTILSPVQLEKVGDVADRIIEKDGVWGVEKNILTSILDSSISVSHIGDGEYDNDTTMLFGISMSDAKYEWIKIASSLNSFYSSKFLSKPYSNVVPNSNTVEGMACEITFATVYVRILRTNLTTQDVTGAKNYLINSILSYKRSTPQFIPLPHDQQIKLRTFANKTNISFLTEIEGTIKAQVPKSLGATVNTHTTQIDNLNKELDRVKKLEESTVSTVETDSDFTVVEQTSNGYFEDVKLEGKTLVNLIDYSQKLEQGSVEGQYLVLNGQSSSFDISRLRGKDFTIIAIPQGNNPYVIHTINSAGNINVYMNKVGSFIKLHKASTDINNIRIYTDSGITEKIALIVLEGDHTQNPPSYFEGLKSVGQGTDEIVVSSVKGDGNLFNECDFYFADWQCNKPIPNGDGSFTLTPSSTGGVAYVRSKLFNLKVGETYKLDVEILNSTQSTGNNYYVWRGDTTENPYNVNAPFTVYEGSEKVRLAFYVPNGNLNNSVTYRVNFYKYKNKNIPYTPHQADKKRLLFYNNETQTWEKPILREWDSIDKHLDGKYYYHQRSGEVVLNGGGNEYWTNAIIASNTNTIRFALNNIYTSATNKYMGAISDKFKIVYNDGDMGADSENIGINGYANALFLTIEKSKLSTQDVEGFKQWLQANNVTVVYQLAEEKVYECTNIDLITYANETNYIVESGAISPKSTLKVHNNISNVVSLLQKKVSLLESNITNYMITQNRMQLASTYSADSVTFKVDYALCSEEVEYNEDLYNLILNNILVGKDNYDYDKMFTMILDYASWNQISWEQFDILVGLMDIQHNPPIEEIPTDDEIVEEIPNEIM